MRRVVLLCSRHPKSACFFLPCSSPPPPVLVYETIMLNSVKLWRQLL